ncbi:two-component system sensor histidine kinase NtrB, partial [Desulfobacula sp.]|uniref:two-component system sensor histidine kinase NtrB n=1 Tax=Desulfobacula sp. TaxID=2593537 RepID=UPI0027153767
MTGKPTYEELEQRIQELERAESDRKQVEELLRESEERYKGLFVNMGSGVAIYEVKGDAEDFIFKDFNKAAEKIYKQKKEELIGRSILEVRPQVDEFGLIDVFREVWKTGKPKHHPITLYQDEKLKAWYENFIYKLPSGEIVARFTDETDSRQMEESLKYSRLQLEAILNNLDSSIYITDMDSHEILFMNNHMKELFGKDLTGQICWKALHKNQDGPCEFCTNDKLIDADKKPTGPYVWEIHNQTLKKWYELHDQAIPWTDGRFVRMEIAFDITWRKQAEEERGKLQEEVLKVRKLESLGTLAGGIAHDLNNLLFAVMGNISLAEDDLKPEIGTSENLKAAEKACIKAKELSARLITFSKGGDPVKKMMSINDLLKDIVISALSGSDIKPAISISDDIRQVNIDEGQIKQVVRNIVVNAKEAMDDNGQLTVSCENVDMSEEGYLTLDQSEYIKISFADQGSGISKENLGKIFDPYFSTKDMGADKGQGLGLT